MLVTEFSLIGMVLAISLAILLLTGLALYVSFRVRETLREEHGKGARAAKVAFLIGLLFLSGGIFYFFATGVSSSGSALTTATSFVTSSKSSFSLTSDYSTSSLSSVTTRSSSATSVSTSTLTTSSTITSTSMSSRVSTSTTLSSSSQTSLSILASFPSSETAGSSFYGSITIVNNGSSTASSVTIQVGNLFNQFSLQSCAMSTNGGASQNCAGSVSGGAISVGSVAPGTIVISLGLTAPSQSGQYSDTLTLYYYVGSEHSISTSVTIRITA